MSGTKIHKSKTYELLKDAFTNDCFGAHMARLFADIAISEGVPVVAGEFTDLARSDEVHATSYFNILRDAGELSFGFRTGHTADNVKALLSREVIKADRCAALIKISNDEGLEEISGMMEEISLGQMTHIARLTHLIKTNVRW